MCSDGISENEYLYIKELLMSESDLKKIVDDICAKSDTFTAASRADDVTVIGMRVKRN
jgi:stage II sporulation protein E